MIGLRLEALPKHQIPYETSTIKDLEPLSGPWMSLSEPSNNPWLLEVLDPISNFMKPHKS